MASQTSFPVQMSGWTSGVGAGCSGCDLFNQPQTATRGGAHNCGAPNHACGDWTSTAGGFGFTICFYSSGTNCPISPYPGGFWGCFNFTLLYTCTSATSFTLAIQANDTNEIIFEAAFTVADVRTPAGTYILDASGGSTPAICQLPTAGSGIAHTCTVTIQ